MEKGRAGALGERYRDQGRTAGAVSGSIGDACFRSWVGGRGVAEGGCNGGSQVQTSMFLADDF